jgi:hypothetical protein
MSEKEREFHRKTAAKCFNSAWDYLEKKRRSRDDERQMLLLAHTSRYHWGLVGTARNRMVGEWQISRVYAELDQPELSINFAKAALDTCKKNSLSEFLASTYEGLARAYAISHSMRPARESIARARNSLRLVKDKEDVKIFEGQIRDTEAMIRKQDEMMGATIRR